MDENKLVERAAATRDMAAFAELVRMHQSRLRGFLLRMTRGDNALADDLAQDSFLEAWRKIAQYRGDGPFFGWLSAIAYSRYLMEARKRKLEPLEDSGERAIETENGQHARLDLERALAHLALPQRAALTACYAFGYSNEEAAKILGMPLGTLKSHVQRGREKLQTLLQGWERKATP